MKALFVYLLYVMLVLSCSIAMQIQLEFIYKNYGLQKEVVFIYSAVKHTFIIIYAKNNDLWCRYKDCLTSLLAELKDCLV